MEEKGVTLGQDPRRSKNIHRRMQSTGCLCPWLELEHMPCSEPNAVHKRGLCSDQSDLHLEVGEGSAFTLLKDCPEDRGIPV